MSSFSAVFHLAQTAFLPNNTFQKQTICFYITYNLITTISCKETKPTSKNLQNCPQPFRTQLSSLLSLEDWKDLLFRSRLSSRELCAWMHLTLMRTEDFLAVRHWAEGFALVQSVGLVEDMVEVCVCFFSFFCKMCF